MSITSQTAGSCDSLLAKEGWEGSAARPRLSSGAEGIRVAPACGDPGAGSALILGEGGWVDAASMSGTPAAIMRATNSSESMVRELLLMVSMNDAAEYCSVHTCMPICERPLKALSPMQRLAFVFLVVHL